MIREGIFTGLLDIASPRNRVFLDAGSEIDQVLLDTVYAHRDEIGDDGVIDVYRKLSVAMIFNTASIIMQLAKDEAEGRRAVAQMAELLPLRINDGMERVIAFALEARAKRSNPHQD